MNLFELGRLAAADERAPIQTERSTGYGLSAEDNAGFGYHAGMDYQRNQADQVTSGYEDAYNAGLSALSGLASIGEGITGGLGIVTGKDYAAPMWDALHSGLNDLKTEKQKRVAAAEALRSEALRQREEFNRLNDLSQGKSDTEVSLRSFGRTVLSSAEDLLSRKTGSIVGSAAEVGGQLAGLYALGGAPAMLGAGGVSRGATMGALDALSVMGEAGKKSRDIAENMTDKDWERSSRYRETVANLINKGMDPMEAKDAAKESLARDMYRTGALGSAPAAFIAGKLTSKLDNLGQGLIRGLPGVMGKESLEEGVQETGGNLAALGAASDILGSNEYADFNAGTGVGESMVLGALGGGMAHTSAAPKGVVESALNVGSTAFNKGREFVTKQTNVAEQQAQEQEQDQADFFTRNQETAPEEVKLEVPESKEAPAETGPQIVEAPSEQVQATEQTRAQKVENIRQSMGVDNTIKALADKGDTESAAKVEADFEDFNNAFIADESDLELLPTQVRTAYEQDNQPLLNFVQDLVDVAQNAELPDAERIKAELSLTSIISNVQDASEGGNSFVTAQLGSSPELQNAIKAGSKLISQDASQQRIQDIVEDGGYSNVAQYVAKVANKENIDQKDAELLTGVLYSIGSRLEAMPENASNLEHAAMKLVEAVDSGDITLPDNLVNQYKLAKSFMNTRTSKPLKEVRKALEDFPEASRVHDEVVRKDASYISTRTHLENSRKAFVKGDMQGATSALRQAYNFGQHKINKAKAALDALAQFQTKYGNGRGENVPYTFEAYNSNGQNSTFESTDNFVNSSPGSVAEVQALVTEAMEVANAVNTMVGAIPGLNVKPLEMLEPTTPALTNYVARAKNIRAKQERAKANKATSVSETVNTPVQQEVVSTPATMLNNAISTTTPDVDAVKPEPIVNNKKVPTPAPTIQEDTKAASMLQQAVAPQKAQDDVPSWVDEAPQWDAKDYASDIATDTSNDIEFNEPIINEPISAQDSVKVNTKITKDIKPTPVKEVKVEEPAGSVELERDVQLAKSKAQNIEVHPSASNQFARTYRVKESVPELHKVRDLLNQPVKSISEAFTRATGKRNSAIEKASTENLKRIGDQFFSEPRVKNFSQKFNQKLSTAMSKNKGVASVLEDMVAGKDVSHTNLYGEGSMIPFIKSVKKKESGGYDVEVDPTVLNDAYTASVMALLTATPQGIVETDPDVMESDDTSFWKSDALSADMRKAVAGSIPISSIIEQAEQNFKNISGIDVNTDISKTEGRQATYQMIGSMVMLIAGQAQSIGNINKLSVDPKKEAVMPYDFASESYTTKAPSFAGQASGKATGTRQLIVYTPNKPSRDDTGYITDDLSRAINDSRFALEALASLGQGGSNFLVTTKYGDEGDALPVPTTIKNSGGTKLTEGSRKAVKDRQAVAYRVNPSTSKVFMGLGKAGVVKLFAGELSEQEAKTLNPVYVSSIEGKRSNIENAYDNMVNQIQQAQDAGEGASIHYAYQVNKNGRLQMVGSANPQSTKLIREAITAIDTDVNLNDTEVGGLYLAGLGQALGVKVHNIPNTSSEGAKSVVADVANGLANKVNTINLLMDRLANDNMEFSAEDINTIKSEQEERSVLELSAMIDVANLLNAMGMKSGEFTADVATQLAQSFLGGQNAPLKFPETFHTHMYVESDGVTNGPFNATALMPDVEFSSHQVRALNRGGMSISYDGKNRTLDEVRALHEKANGDASKAEDAYEEAAAEEAKFQGSIDNIINNSAVLPSSTKDKASTNKVLDSAGVSAEVKAIRQACITLLRFHVGDVKLDQDDSGNIFVKSIKRSLMKNPLTTLTYGAGALSISNKVLETALRSPANPNNLYFSLARAQKRVAKEGGSVEDWLYFDMFAKKGFNDADSKRYSRNATKKVMSALNMLSSDVYTTYTGANLLALEQHKKGDTKGQKVLPTSICDFGLNVAGLTDADYTYTNLFVKGELKNQNVPLKLEGGNLVLSNEMLNNLRTNFFNAYGKSTQKSLETVLPEGTSDALASVKSVPVFLQTIGRYVGNILEMQSRLDETGRGNWDLSRNSRNKIAQTLSDLEINIPAMHSTIAVRGGNEQGSVQKSSATFFGGIQSEVSTPVPAGIGVGSMSAIIQGAGDATMMHKLASIDRTTDVFDGYNMGIGDIPAIGDKPNAAVADSLEFNIMEALIKQVTSMAEVFNKHPEIIERINQDAEEARKLGLYMSEGKDGTSTTQFNIQSGDVKDAINGTGMFSGGKNAGARRFVLMFQNGKEQALLNGNTSAENGLGLNPLVNGSTFLRPNALAEDLTTVVAMLEAKADKIADSHLIMEVAGYSVDQMAGAKKAHFRQKEGKVWEEVRKEARESVKEVLENPDVSYVAKQQAYYEAVKAELSKRDLLKGANKDVTSKAYEVLGKLGEMRSKSYTIEPASKAMNHISSGTYRGIQAPLKGMLLDFFKGSKVQVITADFNNMDEVTAHISEGNSDIAESILKASGQKDANGFYMMVNGVPMIFVNKNAITGKGKEKLLGEIIAHEGLHEVTRDFAFKFFDEQENLGSNQPMDSQKEAALNVIDVAQQFKDLNISDAELSKNPAVANAQYYATVLTDTSATPAKRAEAMTEFISYALSNDVASAKLHTIDMGKSVSSRIKAFANRLKAWVTKMLLGNRVNGLDTNALTHLRYDVARMMAYKKNLNVDETDPEDPNGGQRTHLTKDKVSYALGSAVKDLSNKSRVASIIYDRVMLQREERAVNQIASKAERQRDLIKQSKEVVEAAFLEAGKAANVGLLPTSESKARFKDVYTTFGDPILKERGAQYMEALVRELNPVMPALESQLTQDQRDYINGYGNKGNKNLLLIATAMASPSIANTLKVVFTEDHGKSEGSILEKAEALWDKVLGEVVTGKNLSVAELSEELFRRVAEEAREASLEQMNRLESTVGTKVSNIVNELQSNELVNDINDAIVTVKDQVVENIISNVTNESAKTVLSALHSDTDSFADKVQKIALKKVKSDTGMALARDLTGRTESNAKVFDLVKEAKYKIATARQGLKDGTISLIKDAWKPYFDSNKQARDTYTKMTKALLNTDIVAISDDINTIMNFIQNPEEVSKEVSKLEKELEALDPKLFKARQAKGKDLANYMVNKKVGIGLLRNSLAIAKLATPSKSISDTDAAKASVIIDKLVSAYAYEMTDPKLKDQMRRLTALNNKGMETTLKSIKSMYFNQDSVTNLNEFKGYIPQQSKYGEVLKVEREDRGSLLQANGFNEIGKVNTPKALIGTKAEGYRVYVATNSPEGAWKTQILQTSASTRRGIDLKTGFAVGGNTRLIADRATVHKIRNSSLEETEGLIPVFSQQGHIIAYELALDPKLNDAITYNQELPDMVGSIKSRLVEEKLGDAFNFHALNQVKAMYEQAKREGRTDEYIDVLDPKEVKKLPFTIQEAVRINQNALRKYAGQTKTTQIYVRKDMLDDVLGYRQASIGDWFTPGKSNLPPKVTNTMSALINMVFGDNAVARLIALEKGAQKLTAEARKTIVIRSGVVPAVNMASGLFQLYCRGVSLADAVKWYRTAWRELETYSRLTNKIIEITSQPDVTREHLASVDRIKESITKLSIYPLLAQGELGTIANLGATETDLGLFKGKYLEKIGDLAERLPEPLKVAGRYGYMAENTAIFQLMEKFSQYGDFMAKFAYYNHQKARGEDNQVALDNVKTEFCYYDQASGRARAYAESVGLLHFTNYKLRTIKTALNILAKNPLTTILGYGAPIPDSLGTPVDDNAIAKLMEGSLGYSIGPGMLSSGISLLPAYMAVR